MYEVGVKLCRPNSALHLISRMSRNTCLCSFPKVSAMSRLVTTTLSLPLIVLISAFIAHAFLIPLRLCLLYPAAGLRPLYTPVPDTPFLKSMPNHIQCCPFCRASPVPVKSANTTANNSPAVYFTIPTELP